MSRKAEPSSQPVLHRVVSDEEREVRGQVARLNHALHDVVDGYHLEDGTFLRLEADVTTTYDFQAGDTVKAKGVMTVLAGVVVLDVRTIERVELLGKRHGSD